MKVRIIANYLPQFHPIPENDKYWGAGFTEWNNVVKAKPFFKGHYQPKLPLDLGFYDLRLPEIREQQAKLAREAGIEGFCYWHYWMGNGKQLLHRPFQEVVDSGKPDFPFCVCWANHNWSTRSWKNGKGKNIMIAEQLYPGVEDYIQHFYSLLPAFKDHRYITIDGKPLFVIYDPYHFPDVKKFIQTWRELAQKEDLPGIFFVAMGNNTTTIKRNENGTLKRVLPNLESSKEVYNDFLALGFDGINSWGKSRAEMIAEGKWKRIFNLYIHKHLSFLPTMQFDYPNVVKYFFAPEDNWENVFPTIMPQWDRTARVGKHEGVYVNATPKTFQKHIENAIRVIQNKEDEHKILFLRSWNEWGEGNYVEPDEKYGHGWLQAIANAINL